MKIILLKDVPDLGRQDEVREVADGYGRNFLLKNKLAKIATPTALAQIEKIKEAAAQKSAQELEDCQKLVLQIDGQELEIRAKASKEGKLYASAGAGKIIQELKKKGIDLKDIKIETNQSIKEIGEHEIILSFPHRLEAKVKVIIIPESK